MKWGLEYPPYSRTTRRCHLGGSYGGSCKQGVPCAKTSQLLNQGEARAAIRAMQHCSLLHGRFRCDHHACCDPSMAICTHTAQYVMPSHQ